MARISSPEDLTGYLLVTSPGMWIILAAVIALLLGAFAWSAVGTLETTVDATAIVQDHTAQIVASGQGADELEARFNALPFIQDSEVFETLTSGSDVEP